MSASLVGSEMCIRDRGAGRQARLEVVAPRPTHVDPIRNGANDHPRPVSYTHLTLPTICSV
eukprot:583912-Alexandrium_andersonii.AAC.1